MPQTNRYSYRDDPDVPGFDDDYGLVVFDGVCIFCSRWARFVAANDRERRFRFVLAQSQLGQALYRHYGLADGAVDGDFETNLVVLDGRCYQKLRSLTAVTGQLGWPWTLLVVLDWLPMGVANFIYDRVARNRFAILGRKDVCAPPAAIEDRVIG